MPIKRSETAQGEVQVEDDRNPLCWSRVNKRKTKTRPYKIDVIKDMSRPTDVKGALRFVGLASYPTRFLKKLEDMCEPFRQLTREDAEWHWSNVHESGFKKIEEAASQASVLRYLIPPKRQCFSATPQTLGLEPPFTKWPTSGIRKPSPG